MYTVTFEFYYLLRNPDILSIVSLKEKEAKRPLQLVCTDCGESLFWFWKFFNGMLLEGVPVTKVVRAIRYEKLIFRRHKDYIPTIQHDTLHRIKIVVMGLGDL